MHPTQQNPIATREYDDTLFSSVVEAVAGPVAQLIKELANTLLTPVPQSALDNVACRFADSLIRRNPNHARVFLHDDELLALFTEGTEHNQEMIDWFGFNPVPTKIQQAITAARVRLETKLQA